MGLLDDQINDILARAGSRPRTVDVYFAGKVSQQDWRFRLFSGLRFLDARQRMSHEFAASGFKLPQRGHYRYVGPFFLRDSESAELKHNLVEPADESVISRYAETARWCRAWIEEADAVFAWIDAPDAYGTIAEIGLAHTMGKPIFLAFSHALPAGLIDDLWFIQQLASTVRRGLTVEVAWQEFERWADSAL